MFDLKGHKTTVQTEIIAGLSTFSAMMYILVVNPAILSQAGMDQGALLVATILSSAVMTLLMGLYANLPLALAPGMGLNAFFTYTMCLGYGLSWQSALGLVFYSGVLFFILSLTGLRLKVIKLIPESIKKGLTVGIGLFIALIGLKNAGIIIKSDATLVTLGNLSDPSVLVVISGIVVAAILTMKRFTGSLILSMVFIAAAFAALGKIQAPPSLVSMPPSLEPLFFKLDLGYLWSHLSLAVPLVLSLFFVDLFDNMGTLLSVTKRAKLFDKNGEIKNQDKALRADAFAAMFGAAVGTSSVTSYVESAVGVEQGGRTGLTAVVVAICFLLALFFAPLILLVPIAATTPSLVMVGFFMMSEITTVNFDDLRQGFPAFITAVMIPLTFSISEGLLFGIGVYILMRFFKNKSTQKERPLI